MTRVLQLLAGNANALAFGVGLAVLCASVSAWSRPLAGVILGLVLMTISAWPFLVCSSREP